MRDGYSTLQIALHWAVAVLIVAAFMTGDGMGRVLRDRIESGATGTDGNTPHVWLGGAVFALVLIRIVVRLVQGAPAPVADAPAWSRIGAVWGHRLIYLLMVAVPALGAATWYLGVEAGEAHEILGQALMIVALGHAVIAIWHGGIRQDGTLSRMLRPRA